MLLKTKGQDLYNEVLVDGAFMREQLPGAIEAFVGKNDHDAALYHRFLTQYNLQAVDVAFVKMNSQDWEHPFAPM